VFRSTSSEEVYGDPAASRRPTLAGIRLDGLVWDAGGRVGLPGSIRVGPGEVVAVVATAAVGTAFADVLVGLAPPVAGTARIDDHGAPAGRPDPRLITLVPAGGALLPQRTVAQNIAFGDRCTANSQARDNRVVELAQLFRVAGVLRLHPHRLSPTQRLGVAAARALGSEPHAVVVEDRAGQPDCGVVVAALAGHDVAVIVITDRQARAAPLTNRVYHPKPLPPPGLAKPAPAEPGPAGPGLAESGRAGAGSAEAGSAGAASAEPAPAEPGPGESGPGESGPGESGPGERRGAEPEPARRGPDAGHP
jgi:ABC-type branched-subunit amino acid transport system ATPase component